MSEDRVAAPPSAPRFGRYPEYRDSGVEWLGEIPAHWDVTRLKRISKIVNGGTPKTSERRYWNGPITWITPDDLGRTTEMVIRESNRTITSVGLESCGAQLVPAGSLVLSTRAPIGHLAVAGTDLCTNQGCRSLVFRDQRSCRYVFYQLATARGVLQSRGAGSTFRELSSVNLETLAISAPPLSEQRAIADFLDRETAKIDALIANKEGLVDLLQEKRTALVNRAVTKGLNPDVPMKDSKVEWLGEIPAHWKVARITDLMTLRNGHPFDSTYFVKGAGTPLIRIRDLYEAVTEVGYSGPAVEGAWICRGDVIIGMDGNFNVARWAGERALLNQRMCCVRPRGDTDPAFVAYVLPIPLRVINELTHSTTVKHLSSTSVSKTQIGIPPGREQRTISAFLDLESAKVETLTASIRQAIERLEEFRVALISAAVTGKIDIQDVAA